MEERVVSSALWPGSEIVSLWPGLGIPGAQIPTTGESAGSPLANDGIDPLLEYRMEVVSLPSAGVLDLYPDTSILFHDAPDGTYYWTYEGFETGVSYGTVASPLYVGVTATIDCSISATLDDSVFSGVSYPLPKTIISAALDDAVFSGETYPLGLSLVTISAVLDDAVFSGTSYPKPYTTIAATFDDAVFSGTTTLALLVETWPIESQVLLGVMYGPTGVEYTGSMVPGSGTGATAEEIADAVMARFALTTIDVNAVSGAWPTPIQTADAVWSKVLP